MSTVPVQATLAESLWPAGSRLSARARDAILILGFSLVMVASARLSFSLPSAVGAAYIDLLRQWGIVLPDTPIPVSAQTFAVLLTGLVLGSRRGALAMLTYLGYGLAGLGVFALGHSAWSPSPMPGVPVILGPTAGYLFGFVPAAFIVGLLAERGWDRRAWRAAVAMLIGSAIIYAVGLPWLARYVGGERVLMLGLYPFLAGDLLKGLAAGALLPLAWRLLRATGMTPR